MKSLDQITINEQDYDVLLNYRRGMRNINMRIRTPFSINVSCSPYTSIRAVKKALHEHSDWISKTNTELRKLHSEAEFRPLESSAVFFQGKKHPLQITLAPQKRSKLTFSDQGFTARLCYDQSREQQKRQLTRDLEKFIKDATVTRCKEKLKELQKIDYKSIKSIRFKKMTSRWGSCSNKNNLNFNNRLSLLPLNVQDYIIIHEYSHLFAMNHSKAFWQTVEYFDPNYRDHVKWLKQNERKFI